MTARPAQLRFILVIGILGTLMAHIVEICIFAIGYYVLIEIGQFERLIGNDMYYIGDYIYYSFVTYTTLGFGDLVPMGPIRFLTGMEALSGLVLIAWTASFLYIQMEKLLARKDLP